MPLRIIAARASSARCGATNAHASGALPQAMTSELSLHRQQVSDLRLEQEGIMGQISQVKKRYFQMRQRERRRMADMLELGEDDAMDYLTSMPPASSGAAEGPPMGLPGTEPEAGIDLDSGGTDSGGLGFGGMGSGGGTLPDFPGAEGGDDAPPAE